MHHQSWQGTRPDSQIRGAITLLTNIEGVGVLPVLSCCSIPFRASNPRHPEGKIQRLQTALIEP